MDEIEYTLEERLRNFGLGFLFGAVGLGAAWCLVVIVWAGVA
jgi:hypothetical protein